MSTSLKNVCPGEREEALGQKIPSSSFHQRIEKSEKKCYNIGTFKDSISLGESSLVSSGDMIPILKTERDNLLLIKVDQRLTSEMR